MEIRQLQYVVQIAAEKNFSRAAEKLHIAQPSLSQQLSKLEKEIGVLLFRRTTNSVELTHAGEVFVHKAKSILDSIEQLKQEMDDLAQMRKGKLVVGSLPITGAHVLPLVLPMFQQQYPDIEIVLVEDSSSSLEQLTASGQTDLSLLSLPLQEPSLAWQPLIEEEILLAVPKLHRLAKASAADLAKADAAGLAIPNAVGQQSVDMRELRDEPFIVLKKGQGFRQLVFDLCREAGFEPRIVFESGNIETVQSLVAAGMGIAFVPMMVARACWSSLSPVYLPLGHPAPSRTLVIASRQGRYLSKAADAFIHTMKATVEQHFAKSQ